MKKVIDFVKKEIVLVIACTLAIISCFFVVPNLKYVEYIDFKVLACLFCLMVVVAGMISVNVLNFVSFKLLKLAKGVRNIYLILVFITFFSAMVVTNDVALITFVPLSIAILKLSGMQKYIIYTVVMQTIAANLGSALTPFGNPQNLYLYSYYNMNPVEFFSIMGYVVLISGVLILISVFLIKKINVDEIETKECKIGNPKKLIVYVILFALAVASVFNIIPYYIVFVITILVVLFIDKSLILKVDYSLLLTFVGFFIFVGNMSNINVIKNFLSNAINGRELFSSIVASQVISNVPAAILLSNFTKSYKELLIGVNIGGLGTIIASLASVISFKIYCKEENAKIGKYFYIFTMSNIIFLGILILLVVI